MIITVPDYARFLISVMNEEGYDSKLAGERNRVQVDKGEERVVDCEAGDTACPRSQGYGLGFEVIDYGEFKVVGHGGSDWSELAVAYFYEPSDDAVIVFLNAPNRRALSAMPELIARLDPHSPYLSHYRAGSRARWRRSGGKRRASSCEQVDFRHWRQGYERLPHHLTRTSTETAGTARVALHSNHVSLLS